MIIIGVMLLIGWQGDVPSSEQSWNLCIANPNISHNLSVRFFFRARSKE